MNDNIILTDFFMSIKKVLLIINARRNARGKHTQKRTCSNSRRNARKNVRRNARGKHTQKRTCRNSRRNARKNASRNARGKQTQKRTCSNSRRNASKNASKNASRNARGKLNLRAHLRRMANVFFRQAVTCLL